LFGNGSSLNREGSALLFGFLFRLGVLRVLRSGVDKVNGLGLLVEADVVDRGGGFV